MLKERENTTKDIKEPANGVADAAESGVASEADAAQSAMTEAQTDGARGGLVKSDECCRKSCGSAEEKVAAASAAPSEAAEPAEGAAHKGILYRLVLKLCFGNKRLAEIVRFAIVGGVATIADFFIMGVVLYIFDPSLYPDFINVFYGGGTPTVLASCVGTGVGFLGGLAVNYVLSVFFVFDEKGNSESFRGFVLFAALSAGGFFINVLGMYLCVDLAGWNEWVIKIVMTLIVLVYNYVTRKLIIFRKSKKSGS